MSGPLGSADAPKAPGHPTQPLIAKYNVPGPRYTSYPTVPYWDESTFHVEGWRETVRFEAVTDRKARRPWREELRHNWQIARRWEPAMDAEQRGRLFNAWQKAVTRSLGWVDQR